MEDYQPEFELNLDNPLHAKAYLAAASHFLSGWNQDWTAEELALALVSENSPKQSEIRLWNAIKNYAASIDQDPYLQTDSQICDMAETILTFHYENALSA